jgi:hypothetical protein
MRALGPGSVSSFLKIILDVIYVGLWVWVSLLAIFTVAVLLLSFNPELITSKLHIGGSVDELINKGPLFAGALGAWALLSGGWMVIVERLRRVFSTLTAGDPFHPDNVRRLRVVGLVLAALEIGHYIFAALAKWLAPDTKIVDGSFSLSAWFPVLVVFVLAEVFREGARLRREAELTI